MTTIELEGVLDDFADTAKAELQQMCAERGVEFKKRWTREELIRALAGEGEAPKPSEATLEALAEAAEQEANPKVVEPLPEPTLEELEAQADEAEAQLTALRERIRELRRAQGPVGQLRKLFDEKEWLSRGQFAQAAVDRGINRATAQTYWQKLRTA